MGMAAWWAVGEVAQLPAWNAALAELGDNYDAVENPNVSEQTKAHVEDATPQLRAFARHVAIAADDAMLFHSVEAVGREFNGEENWSKRWWDVPFAAVLEALAVRYKRISGVGTYVALIEGSDTAKRLRDRLEERNISTVPDPYEIADVNGRRFEQFRTGLRDLYRAWIESVGSSDAGAEVTEPQQEFDGSEYLGDWSDAELLEMALLSLDDQQFKDACGDCSTLAAIRQKLDLTSEAIEAKNQERLQKKREAERRRRTFDVAGDTFEAGVTSYRDLFGRVDGLPVPNGPRASRDELTALLPGGEGKQGGAGGGPGRGNAPTPRPPSDVTDVVGVMGEIWAYKFLRSEFTDEVVKRECWVSEIRRSALPPMENEPHDVSDSHGFDFRFTDRKRRKWHVEVKATNGDDTWFDIGISEIKAATQLARARGGRWRILRVRKALSVRPEFDWLPNPFEDEFGGLFRLRQGGMRVSYSVR